MLPESSSRRFQWALLLALVALSLALGFLDLGRMALLDPDEARYAETSREMIERRDYAVPYYNGEVRLKKPPLFHWEQIAAFELFGTNEWAARLPSTLAALALMGVLLAFGWLECGGTVALKAGAILITCPLVFVAGRMVIIDMTLSLFICSALFLYYLLDRGRVGRRAGAILIGILLGAAVLAKGPVGLLVPGIVIGAYHLVLREWRAFTRWRGVLLATAVAAALVLPWLGLVIHRVGFDTFSNVVFRETVERYVETGLEHPQGAWFFLVIMGLAAFPWSAFLLPSYASGALRYLRPQRDAGGRLGAFLWVWIAGMLVFFSLGKGKLATYILPVMPAAALYLAREWERWGVPRAAEETKARKTNLEWVVGLSLFVPTILLAYIVIEWDPAHAQSFLQYKAPFGLMALAAMLGAILLSARSRRWAVVPLLTACVSVFYFYAIVETRGVLEHYRSLKEMVRETGLDRKPEVRLCVYRDFHPSLVFYTGRRVERADAFRDLESFLKEPGEAVVVMDTDRLASLNGRFGTLLRQIGVQDRQVALKKGADVTADMIDSLRPQPPGPRHRRSTSASGPG